MKGGIGYRIYQVKKPENRHLVDVRPVDALPPAKRVKKVLVVTPAELIANKTMAYTHRRGKPKAGTDWRDLAMMLLKFPELKTNEGPVAERLRASGATPETLGVWKELVAQDIRPEDEDDEF